MTLIALTAVLSSLRSPLRSQTYSFPTTPHFWLYLPNAETTLDLEANEVEVKVLTSLASVTELTGAQNMNHLWVAKCKELIHEHSQFLVAWLSPFAEKQWFHWHRVPA